MISIGATGGNIKAQYDEAMTNYKKYQNLRDDAKKKIDRLTKGPTAIDDLSNPWHYSRDKNPRGSGTQSPDLLVPNRSGSISKPGSLSNPDYLKKKYPYMFK